MDVGDQRSSGPQPGLRKRRWGLGLAGLTALAGAVALFPKVGRADELPPEGGGLWIYVEVGDGELLMAYFR